jgi:hypothetical protein
MAVRIANQAAPGTLLDKRRRSNRVRSDAPGQRKPRERDEAYLKLVRKLPCLRCGSNLCIAAHVRMSAPGESPVGIGTKPDDSRVLPLCEWCHTNGMDAQHRVGETAFYSELGIDPIKLAKKLYAAKPDISAMQMIIFKARKRFA